MAALEDALLSAYKKTPGSAKYARVDMDRGSADFRVFELLVPDELEEQLLAEVEPEEPTIDPETGEMTEPPRPKFNPRSWPRKATKTTNATGSPAASAASARRPASRGSCRATPRPSA